MTERGRFEWLEDAVEVLVISILAATLYSAVCIGTIGNALHSQVRRRLKRAG